MAGDDLRHSGRQLPGWPCGLVMLEVWDIEALKQGDQQAVGLMLFEDQPRQMRIRLFQPSYRALFRGAPLHESRSFLLPTRTTGAQAFPRI